MCVHVCVSVSFFLLVVNISQKKSLRSLITVKFFFFFDIPSVCLKPTNSYTWLYVHISIGIKVKGIN